MLDSGCRSALELSHFHNHNPSSIVRDHGSQHTSGRGGAVTAELIAAHAKPGKLSLCVIKISWVDWHDVHMSFDFGCFGCAYGDIDMICFICSSRRDVVARTALPF